MIEILMNQRQVLNDFYHSRTWRRVRWIILHKYRGICQKCGKAGNEVHHIIPLTPLNVHDASIALNPDNLILLCTSCHNAERSPEVQVRSDVCFDKQGNLLKKSGPPRSKSGENE